MTSSSVLAILLGLSLATAPPTLAAQNGATKMETVSAGVYAEESGAIVGRNLKRYHNRALYGNKMPTFVLAGDLPHIRFAHEPYVCGCLMLAIDREGKAKWLQDFSDVESRFHDAHMTWNLFDSSLPGLTMTLDVVPMAYSSGFCVRLAVKGALPSDKLIWAYGGATERPPGGAGGSIANALDVMAVPNLITRGFAPEDCRGNTVAVNGGIFAITPPLPDPAADTPRRVVVGQCSVDSAMMVADATGWANPAALVPAPTDLPMAVGAVSLTDGELFWAMESFDTEPGVVPGEQLPPATKARVDDPAKSFQAGMRRCETVAKQVVVETPDKRFNAYVSAACAALDGLFRPPQIMHGGMSWNMPYMGWRTMYGPTAFGWHDIVRTAAKLYIATQEKTDAKKAAHADPALGYTAEAMDSRFYGLGHLNHGDQWRYDMQSVLFDMVIHAWRWTGDPELEKALRGSLDLHLKWMRDCFDPDDDGVYESYQNTAEVDQVWYNGGGTAEETAYAYNAEVAAMELARKAGDVQDVRDHTARAKKIQNGLMHSLWIPTKGYIGAYREQIGLRRLHEDSWLYSIFLPIDAQMLTDQQAVQALHYTEWGLQRDKMPLGGERCWTSNWIPTTWSSRTRWTGHAYSLALAYCQAGLPDQAWEVMKGGFLESGYNGIVPGGCDGEGVGMDFHETSCTFARAVVEGVFGYRPNYPNSRAHMAPSFPSDWDHASIKTPDFSLFFRRKAGVDDYTLKLTNAANVTFDAPIRARRVTSVTVDGKRVGWKATPGYGQSIISVHLRKRTSARVVIKWTGALPQLRPATIAATAGEPVRLEAAGGAIVKVEDPQKVFAKEKLSRGVVSATVGENAGNHMVLALVDVGQLSQWQLFALKVSDPKAEAAADGKVVKAVPSNAKWTLIDIEDHLNGDVRTIYKQEYLSPRPKTCSVRIGSNGFSSWPFYFWGIKLPEIDLSNVEKLLESEIEYPPPHPTQGRLVTPQGAPFTWQGGERNIAFTSQWDNWPHSVTLPVGKKGKAVWLLVCGSTNPMQGKIVNAEIRLNYSHGAVDKLEIVPPYNFWSLCGLPDGKDYDVRRDAFALGKTPPMTVQLGNNCRAIVLNQRLRPNATLESVTLETLSQEVVIGLMGITVME